MPQITVPCVVYRGGTSRGLFFHEGDLPKEEVLREKIFLKGIGAEDHSHVNGLGGGTSHTSKVVIIDRSEHPNADVNYTFVQLGIGSTIIDYEGTCGNLMAAVGAFAVDEGMVDLAEETESIIVKVWNTNINKYLKIKVPLENGKAKVTGKYHLPGISDSGAKITVDVEKPGGGKTGKTMPLSPENTLLLGAKNCSYSFCDIVNPFVYVNASSLGLTGKELNDEVANNTHVMETLEAVRKHIAVKGGLAADLQEALNKYPALPKVAFVSDPKDYKTSTGKWIKKEEYDILARMVSMKKMHRTFAVSGLLNLAGASLLDGTIPNNIFKVNNNDDCQIVRIGHPEGVISIRVKKSKNKESIEYVGLESTARKIISGTLYVPQ